MNPCNLKFKMFYYFYIFICIDKKENYQKPMFMSINKNVFYYIMIRM